MFARSARVRLSGRVKTRCAIAELARRLDCVDPPVQVIAVYGHSAAGKSTFARELAQRFGAACVPGDDFYRVMDPGVRSELSPEEGARLYYDWERMLGEAIAPLRAGRAATYRPFDWARNRLGAITTTVAPAKVVVVNGLVVSRPDLDDVVDVAAVVAADPSLRVQRQFDRNDATEDWLERWDAAERWFFEHVRPIESFDLIVDGESS